MLFKSAVILLVTWLLGVVFVSSGGDALHVVLLVGLALVFLAFLRAREGAMRRALESPEEK
jgi:hypothetical protein